MVASPSPASTTPADPAPATAPDAEPAPARAEPSLPRHRALDGLRGVAVAAVVIFHLDLGWMPGGFLGVSLFFTLSGFLITSLVLRERDHRGRVDTRSFWGRRFRRLLPAAWAGLGVAVAYALAAGEPEQLRRLPGDVIAALAYVANWHFIVAGDAYTAGYQAPSPILHYWSLAIEEQFYVLFPLLVLALVARRASRRTWVIVLGALAAASMVSTLVLYDPDHTTRVYFGTTTRAFEILAGALLAVALPRWWTHLGDPEDTTARKPPIIVVQLIGAAALAATIALWLLADTTDDWLYRGGLWLVALASCALIYSVMHSGLVATVLSWKPLVALGIISYGVYVYHWPLFLWISTDNTGLTGAALAAARLGATFALALVSYYVLERPVRRGRVHLTPPVIGGASLALVLIVAGSFIGANHADDRAVADAQASRSSTPLVTQPPVTAHGDSTTIVGATPPSTAAIPPPKRVLILGDSIVHQAYPVIADRFAKEGIDTKAIGGPGESLLAHQGEWQGELEQAIRDYDPDVVVLESCCGYGDSREPYVVDGKPLALDTPELWAAWRRAAEQAVTTATGDGRTVAWVLAPPAKTNGYYGPIEQRIAQANDIALDLAHTHPDLEVVDWRVLAGPDGSYTESLPDANGQMIPVRAKDGLHFTPAGMDVLADVTYDAVIADWQARGGR